MCKGGWVAVRRAWGIESVARYAYDNSGALATVYDSESGISATYYYDLTDRMVRFAEKGDNYSHSIGYEYDTINNLTQVVESVNGVAHTTSYAYDLDNRITGITTDGVTKAYTYDAYGRITQQVTSSGGATVLTETYTYTPASDGKLSAQVAAYRTQSALYDVTYTYTYDNNGNILSISDGTNTVSYVYDSANQLIRENDQAANKTTTWSYDNAGNILSESTYAYTTGELGSASSVTEYTYGDSAWGDLLTAYDGESITYDAIGNPTRDHADNTYTWKQGRQLASYKEDGNEAEDVFHFVYNADGLRVKAYNAYTTYRYIYSGTKLLQMEISNTSTGAVSHTLSFTYDAQGTPQTVTYNGTVYYYAANLQGDVTAILDSTGAAVVTYSYDAWGHHTSGNNGTGTLASTLGKHNPLRYRGYVFDTESGLYYLQSRYYNPEIGRFINSDAYTSTGQGLLGNNMFVYCRNNSISRIDKSGTYDDYAGWVGGEIGKLLYELLYGDDYPDDAAQLVDYEVQMAQNEYMKKAVDYLWGAYMDSIELQNQQQYQQAKATIDAVNMLGDFVEDRFSTLEKASNTLAACSVTLQGVAHSTSAYPQASTILTVIAWLIGGISVALDIYGEE